MISNWAEQDWKAFSAVQATGDRTAALAALQSFLLGVAYREEELSAHDLSELLDRAGLSGAARAELAEDVEFALGLLAAYGRLIGTDENEDDDYGFGDTALGGREPGIGELVI